MTEPEYLFNLSQKHDLNANLLLWALLTKQLAGSSSAYLHTLRDRELTLPFNSSPLDFPGGSESLGREDLLEKEMATHSSTLT